MCASHVLAQMLPFSIRQAHKALSSSDPTDVMITLRTENGFSVCFSIPRQQQSAFGEALVAQPAPRAALFTPATVSPSRSCGSCLTEGFYGYTVAKNVSHKTMSP